MGILEELPMTTGERIKFFRENNKITQKSFAIAIGISQTHISKIENNQDNPSDKLLHLISATFSINYEWLKYGTGSIQTKDDIKNSYSLNQCLYDIKQLSNEIDDNAYRLFLNQIQQLMRLYKQNTYFKSYFGCEFMTTIMSCMYQLMEYWISTDKKYKNLQNGKLSYDECAEIKNEIYETSGLYINEIQELLNQYIPMIFASWSVMENYIDKSYEEFINEIDNG